MNRIGKRVKQFRKFLNYTQAYMAKKLDISQGAYSRIENDKIELSIARLNQIASILKIPQAEFLNSQSIKPNNIRLLKGNNKRTKGNDSTQLLVLESTIRHLKQELSIVHKENKSILYLLMQKGKPNIKK